MCHQSVGLLQDAIERAGISTISLSVRPEVTLNMNVPRAAYVRFKDIFYGDRFAELRDAGAPVQRPLWASTGVKNPKYSGRYINSLTTSNGFLKEMN